MKQFYVLGTRIIFVLGIIAALFILLPVLSYEGLEYAGYEIVFGKELVDVNPFNLGTIASARFPFSILAFFAFILPLVAGVIAIFSKRAVLISCLLFIVSFFFLLILPNNISIVYTVLGQEETASVDWNMMFGLIGALITTGLGALASLVLISKP